MISKLVKAGLTAKKLTMEEAKLATTIVRRHKEVTAVKHVIENKEVIIVNRVMGYKAVTTTSNLRDDKEAVTAVSQHKTATTISEHLVLADKVVTVISQLLAQAGKVVIVISQPLVLEVRMVTVVSVGNKTAASAIIKRSMIIGKLQEVPGMDSSQQETAMVQKETIVSNLVVIRVVVVVVADELRDTKHGIKELMYELEEIKDRIITVNQVNERERGVMSKREEVALAIADNLLRVKVTASKTTCHEAEVKVHVMAHKEDSMTGNNEEEVVKINQHSTNE